MENEVSHGKASSLIAEAVGLDKKHLSGTIGLTMVLGTLVSTSGLVTLIC